MDVSVFKKNSRGALLCLLTALAFLFPHCLNAQIQAPDGVKIPPAGPEDSDRALSDAMAMINSQKFGQAKKTLREAIRKDPINELLWLSYDSCIRSEMLAKNSAGEGAETAAPVEQNSADGGKTTDATAELYQKNAPTAAPAIYGGSIRAASDTAAPAANENEEDIDCAILETDFTGGAASGDLACLLNDTFKFINAGGGFYLSARAKDKNATVSFSFDIAKFPKKVKLQIAHRLVKKDRFLSAAPLIIDLNEHKVNYDSIRLGNKVETNEYDITNMSRSGANILTLNVENPAYPYLLKNVKVLLYFKD